jgi:hypothetical protein
MKVWENCSRELQVYWWMFRCNNIIFLTSRFFDVLKFTFLTPLSLLSWSRLLLPIVSWKTSCLTHFAFESPKRIFVCYLRKWSKTWYNCSYKLSFESSLFFSLGACTFKKILDYLPLRTIHDILLLTNSALLTTDAILWCTINLLQIFDFNFLFHLKKYIILCF